MKQKVIFKSILVLLITVSCFFSEGINLLSKPKNKETPFINIYTENLNLQIN